MKMAAEGRGISVGFIGAGVLGSGLALALHRAGYTVSAVASRRRTSAAALAARIPGCADLPAPQDVAHAVDLVFITTPDAAIGPVAAALDWRDGQYAVHCCGALGLEVLEPAAARGAITGAFHPFQTFAGLDGQDGPELAARRLDGVTFAVAAEGELASLLQGIAADLGGRAVGIADELRPLYHASAVLSCGYLVTLLQAAVEVWQAAGFSEEEALSSLLPVSRATLENVARLGIKASVTGPLVRGDVATVERHLAALAGSRPEVARLYGSLTEKSLAMAEELGLSPAGAASLRRTLAELSESSTLSTLDELDPAHTPARSLSS